MKPFTLFIKNHFDEHRAESVKTENPQVTALRDKAMRTFLEKELPANDDEAWKNAGIDQKINHAYTFQTAPLPFRPVDEYFKCKVKNIDTFMFSFLNGWYVHQHAPLTVFPDGMIAGSILAAIEQCPEKVLPYLTSQQPENEDGLSALNKALFNDGFFIYIPDNITVSKPMQVVSLVDTTNNLMLHNRNLIVLGKNASLSFVQCDDSLHFGKCFINNSTDIFLEQHARLNYVKMENKDADSLLFNHIYVNQKKNATFTSDTLTFNAGYVRNTLHVDLMEPFSEARLYGLCLVDKKQFADNRIYVNHCATDCTSYQLYKNIADDQACANFNGHITVQPDAQRTSAFQANKNITLTDEAIITTKPFLEIYADDVKCSHGATVGQLDDEALFYLRSRGICERNARMLLMYAFANEIANYVNIDSLRERITDMIKKRLSGELNLCDQCVLHCSDEKNFSFEIDISKI